METNLKELKQDEIINIIIETFNKVKEVVIKLFNKIKEFICKIDIYKYKKYKKYQKRVENRNKLYHIRKSKYGKYK